MSPSRSSPFPMAILMLGIAGSAYGQSVLSGDDVSPILSAQKARSGVRPAGDLPANAVDEPAPFTPFLPDLTPGYVVVENDIQIRLDEYLRLLAGADATFGAVTFWNNTTVPYDFVTAGTGAVSAANQTNAVNAMSAIQSRTGLTFRPAVGSEDRIRFQSSNFNNSPVGRQGGSQIINIVSWGTQIIIVHEIFHSLGFWHEQSRSDRGSYITINAGNICGASTVPEDACNANVCNLCADGSGAPTSCAFNFNIQPGTSTYGGYDFDSFMHYGRTAFSCNGGDTITVNAPWNAQWQNAIGQRDHFSFLDAITCRGLYPYSTDRWLSQSYFGAQAGTFLQPWNVAFASALASTPNVGTLLVSPGTYSAVGVYTAPRTIIAPLGATFGN